MLDKNVRDGLLFTDENTGDTVIFNYYTFCQIIIGCMSQYGGVRNEEAKYILAKSTIITKPPVSYADVTFLTHEYEYHWAMVLVYGENYWSDRQGISSELPADYDKWEYDYIAKNNLADSSYEYQ